MLQRTLNEILLGISDCRLKIKIEFLDLVEEIPTRITEEYWLEAEDGKPVARKV